MSSQLPQVELPDTVVRAIRDASKPFLALQSSRYASATTSASTAHKNDDAAPSFSLVMRTKTPQPDQQDNSTRFDVRHVQPSRWSEHYRQAFAALPDAAAQRLWGLVSTVLNLLESSGASSGGHGADAAGVETRNASLALVQWNDRYDTSLTDAAALVMDLQQTSPQMLEVEVVEVIGSNVLGRIEDAFLTGHFEVAATLMDALVVFLRRGGASLLTAEVETALADVRRLLATAFHDADSYLETWVRGANEQLQESRNTLLATVAAASKRTGDRAEGVDEDSGAGRESVVDDLVGDLCATCVDVLVLITKDATQLVERCKASRRSAVDFLVAVCAIMEPYAPLPDVAAIFAEYVSSWEGEEEDEEAEGEGAGLHARWYYEAIQTVLEVESLSDMVRVMEQVAQISVEVYAQAEAAADNKVDYTHHAGRGRNRDDGEEDNDDEMADDDDEPASDTVSLAEIQEAPREVRFDGTSVDASVDRAFARRFLVAGMAAHVADLCAPVAIAGSAADMPLTFARNNLVVSYAELFAHHARTWRIAGLYACYSPLLNPEFLVDVVTSATDYAAADATAYQSLLAFFHTSWSTNSELQTAVRGKLESVLPRNATVMKWWTAMDFCYAAAHRQVHCRLVEQLVAQHQWARAAWLAVEVGLTDALQSRLRHTLASAAALADDEVYVVGCAVQRGFVAWDTVASAELARYLQAAASVAAYRQAATTATVAVQQHQQLMQQQQQRTNGLSVDGASAQTATAVAACLCAIEAVLKCTDACDVMLHPTTTFTLVEHGTGLLLTLRQLMCDPLTGDSTASLHVTSCVLPLLVEAYQLSSIHFGRADPTLERRSRVVGEKLAQVHQTCI